MNRALRVFALLCVALVLGCGHKISDADLVGTWKVDPAAVAGKDSDVMTKMTFTLTADHQYVMAGTEAMSVKGMWGYLDKKLTITPTTLILQSPFEPGKTLEMPVAQALRTMQKMSTDANTVKALRTMSQPSTFDVSDDGKKMTDNGKAALIKSA